MTHPNPNEFMKLALKQAEMAWKDFNEVPIGAVIVKGNEVIAEAHNLKESTNNPTHHAEILALSKASERLGRWRLEDCDMYVTLEPCPMCAGALVQARVKNLYFGAFDPKSGACGSLFQITKDERLNHRLQVFGGVLEAECSQLLKDFFKIQRQKI